MSDDRLKRYEAKRDLAATPEPSGGRPSKGSRFVIQRHDASSLHYDFRLEADGVLKSWAVPKGPSMDPRDKRLAMPTEDHPLDYAAFEGVIPQGHYGAGTVIVWDAGTYRNTTTDEDGGEVPISRAVEEGHVSVWLEGKKVLGGYSLTRLATGKDERWILVKKRDEGADARRKPTSTQPESVLSGRTNEDLEASQGDTDG